MRIPFDSPPIFTATPASDLRAFLDGSMRSKGSAPREPYRGHMEAGKFSPLYRAHTYHTKVPPQGIEPFIRHYTEPGEVVLDPFCGSGMTGLAALATGRRAVLSDLSPAAAFIAYHHCTPIDREVFLEAAKKVTQCVEKRLAPLYGTACARCGAAAEIAFTVWAEQYRCPDCDGPLSLWRDGLDALLHVRSRLTCPRCKLQFSKPRLRRDGIEPALVHADCPHCGRQEQPPTASDLDRIRRADQELAVSRLWYPRDPIGEDNDELKRVLRSGVRSVDQLFTARNLLVLSSLYAEIATASASGDGLAVKKCVSPVDLQQKLLFALTASMPRTSRTNKYIPHLHMAPGPILGTMYIPGFYPELNVLRHFRTKARDIGAAMSASPQADFARSLRVQICSATRLTNLPDRSIDYVFTDPPFGSNISYSDLNFLWESWLGVKTERADEAVVSRAQQKPVERYGDLMRQSFEEIRRVLKPGRWMTLVFHNSSSEVWEAIVSALARARLQPEACYTFDKRQESFKQVTADGALASDVVLHCRRTSGSRAASRPAATHDEVLSFISASLFGGTPTKSPDHPRSSSCTQRSMFDAGSSASSPARSSSVPVPPLRSIRRLYSHAIAHFLSRGKRLDLDFAEFRKLIPHSGA